MTSREITTILDATGADTLDEAILQQMEAAVLETDSVYSVVTGEPVEPDHPDGLPYRMGMI